MLSAVVISIVSRTEFYLIRIITSVNFVHRYKLLGAVWGISLNHHDMILADALHEGGFGLRDERCYNSSLKVKRFQPQ